MTHKDEDQTKDDRDACCERADPDEYFGGRAEIISGTIMPGLCAYMINAFNTHIFSVNAKFTANFALQYILRAPIDDLLELLDQYWLMEGREWTPISRRTATRPAVRSTRACWPTGSITAASRSCAVTRR